MAKEDEAAAEAAQKRADDLEAERRRNARLAAEVEAERRRSRGEK